MADQYTISAANLNYIESNLNNIHKNLAVIDADVGQVNDNVKVVYDEIGSLAQDFHRFVMQQERANRYQLAETRLVKIRQDLETKFGHYEEIRKATTGILQADDLGLVRKDTISTATEEMMIMAPNYWLAPALIALSAWINDQKELSDKAIVEAIRRDDEKTSLLMALICRRAGRKQACLKWTQRYLELQDAEALDRKAIIILDAYASGLLGADSEGVIARQMEDWLDHLSAKPGFVEKQTEQWSEAINLKRPQLDENDYPYLRKYSKTWPVLEDVMEGAKLHANLLSYFMAIFEQEGNSASIKEQLDEILNSLVKNFDDEELPLRKQERKEELVVEFEGDEDEANRHMQVEQTSFETHKDFTQLLTDAAMKPETSHSSVSTQKFAIALSKEWISNAYRDVVAQNRMKVPTEIEINVDTFNGKSADGQNEAEVLADFNALIDREKADALAQLKLSGFERFCLYGGAAIAVIGLIMCLAGNALLGVIAVIAGAGMVINHFSKKKQLEVSRQNIETNFEQKRTNGAAIIRAMLAEIVDFRMEFREKDSESEKVAVFLEAISPEQYVKRLADSNRRIRVAN